MNKLYVVLACVFVFGIGTAIASNVVNLKDFIDVRIVDPLHDGYVSVVAIDYEHFETHEGDHYFIKTYIHNTGVSGSCDYFAFTTPETNETRVHARVLLVPDIDFISTIYEDATISGGVSISGVNNDRDSTNAAELEPVGAPTVIDDGEAIWVSRNGGGKDPVGVAPGLNYEIIAKTNSTYLFELCKQVANDGVVNIDFWWYEDGGPPYE